MESIFLALASVSYRTQSSACPGQERPHLAAPCAALGFPQARTCGFVRRAPLLPGCTLPTAANQQSKAPCMIPQPEKTTRLGPSGYQFPPSCPSPTSPRSSEIRGRVIGNHSEGPKFTSGGANWCLGRCAYPAVP